MFLSFLYYPGDGKLLVIDLHFKGTMKRGTETGSNRL